MKTTVADMPWTQRRSFDSFIKIRRCIIGEIDQSKKRWNSWNSKSMFISHSFHAKRENLALCSQIGCQFRETTHHDTAQNTYTHSHTRPRDILPSQKVDWSTDWHSFGVYVASIVVSVLTRSNCSICSNRPSFGGVLCDDDSQTIVEQRQECERE